VEKRYNYRIYPTKEQEVLIQKIFGCCRFVYNHYLAKRIEAYEKEGRLFSLNECGRDLTLLKREAGMEWLAEADANALLVALKELDRAYKAFFRRLGRGGAPGFPKFRSKRGRGAYTSRKNIKRRNIEVEEGAIKLPKLGRVRCKVSRPAKGRILSATVLQTRGGKYFVSVCCTDEIQRPLPKTGKAAGLHLGIRDLLVTSEGERIENPRYFERSEKKIARLSRRLSRKSKDGRNREKARIKLARAHERVANQRNDYLNKLTTRLVRTYDFLCIRDTRPAARMKDKRFAKRIADASWSGLIARLRCKCDWYGKELILADAFFPSARTCGACGAANAEAGRRNDLREWTCPACGARHDRGVNAARNVLREGLRIRAARAETGDEAAAEACAPVSGGPAEGARPATESGGKEKRRAGMAS
jgi:putative transposase